MLCVLWRDWMFCSCRKRVLSVSNSMASWYHHVLCPREFCPSSFLPSFLLHAKDGTQGPRQVLHHLATSSPILVNLLPTSVSFVERDLLDEFPLHFYNACLCSSKSFSVHSQEDHPIFLVAWSSWTVPFSLSCCGIVCHRTVTAKRFRLCLSHVACSSIPVRFRGEDTHW